MDEPIEPLTQEIKRRGLFAMIRDGVESAAEFFDEVYQKCNNLTETNYKLACELARRGEVDDAIMRFKITRWLAPNHIQTLYNLGCLYHHKGLHAKAMECFTQVIRKQPTHQNAIYMVASIDPSLLKAEMLPRMMPADMAIEYFDSMAANYDFSQQAKVYQLPALVHQLLHVETGKLTNPHDLLDLGCGTGLCGAQFREEFANIVGIDISNMMLDEAYRKMDGRGVKIFTRLAHRDLRAQLQEEKPESFDVAMCISVLPYIGDLELLLAGVQRVLRREGIFACSFDPYVINGQRREAYGMMPKTGNFGHDVQFVLQRAAYYGLEPTRTGEVLAYPQKHVQLCFFRKA